MQLELSKSKQFFKDKNIQNFIHQLEERLTKKDELTNYEIGIYTREKSEFLHNFFDKRMKNLENGETFLVCEKYYNDPDGRYSVTQYIDNYEKMKVAFKENLPEDVKVRRRIIKKSRWKLLS